MRSGRTTSRRVRPRPGWVSRCDRLDDDDGGPGRGDLPGGARRARLRSGRDRGAHPASEAWAARTGVYQDTAHVSLRALRAVGIPARYVSGYLYPLSGGELGQTVVGE